MVEFFKNALKRVFLLEQAVHTDILENNTLLFIDFILAIASHGRCVL